MEILVACPGCQRRRDLSGLEPGTTVPCSCGASYTVPAPFHGDADVVRCSSCGGPREAGEARCRFCKTEFTIHERDLDVVCSQCFHRASSRSRYCHHCGQPLLRDQASQSADMTCPACGDETRLSSRRLGTSAMAVLECRRCAGLWLDWQTFRMLEERAQAGAESGAATGPMGSLPVDLPPPGTRLYRPCPVCGKLMHRRNYGRSSGVLIDTCTEHGLWFDHDELGQILRWIGTGGLERQALRRQEELAAAERSRRVTADSPSVPTGSLDGGWLGGDDPFRNLDIVTELVRWVAGLLRGVGPWAR
ncbi:MAG: zf-TFIIB domain-containing protein [Acidobacteria bacterium]|nr:zf-TFIIB domain-containing protein [Acidobacteriota bacterium]